MNTDKALAAALRLVDGTIISCEAFIASTPFAANAAGSREALAEWREVKAALVAMREQRGCEHFDPAVTDGKLTTLVDVIVHG